MKIDISLSFEPILPDRVYTLGEKMMKVKDDYTGWLEAQGVEVKYGFATGGDEMWFTFRFATDGLTPGILDVLTEFIDRAVSIPGVLVREVNLERVPITLFSLGRRMERLTLLNAPQ